MVNKSLFKEARTINQVGGTPPEPLGLMGGLGVLAEGGGVAAAGLGEALRAVPQLLTAGTSLLNIAVGAVSDGVIMLKSGVNFSKQELTNLWVKYVSSPGQPNLSTPELREDKYSDLDNIVQTSPASSVCVSDALAYHARFLFFQYKIDELNRFHEQAVHSLAEVEQRINIINQKKALFHTKIRGLNEQIELQEDYLTHIQDWDEPERINTKLIIRKLIAKRDQLQDNCDYIEERPAPLYARETYPWGSANGGTESIYMEDKSEMRMVDLLELQKYLEGHIIEANYASRLDKYRGEMIKNAYALNELKKLKEFEGKSTQDEFIAGALKLEEQAKSFKLALRPQNWKPSFPRQYVDDVMYYSYSEKREILRKRVEEEEKRRSGAGGTVRGSFHSF